MSEEDDARRQVASRFADIDQEDGATRSPIAGLFPEDLHVPTLQDALASVAEVLPGYAWDSKRVKIALRHSKKVHKTYNFMSMDEIPSIVLYTMEDNPRENSLYFVMNKALRDKNREGVKKWRDFIWLFLHALKKLPAAKTMSVVRGAKTSHNSMGLDLGDGDDFTWSGFSSVTTTIDVMKDFLGDIGDRTLIQLELVERIARDVKGFSFFPSENELLLPPNVCFEYVSKFDCGGGLVIVQARQIESLDSLLDLNEEEAETVAGSGMKAVSTLKKDTNTLTSDLKSTKTLTKDNDMTNSTNSLPENREEEEMPVMDDAPEVREFLAEAKLSQFGNKIVQAGFDDLDTVRSITEDDLKELGLQVGHRRKFMVALKQLESSQGEKKPEKKEAAVEKPPDKPKAEDTKSEPPKATGDNAKDGQALYDGARNGHADVIQTLVATKADVNFLTDDKFFPLYVGASNGQNDAVKALIDAKADVNKGREDGATALLIGAQRGRETCVRHLVGARADTDKAMTDGCTPIYIASQKGETACVKVLLEAKANLEKTMKDDCAPLYISSQHGHNGVVQALLAGKANVNHGMNDNSSPLFIASQKGNGDCVKSLISAKADLKTAMKGGASPIFISSQHGHLSVVKDLATAKADVEQAMDNGVAPLRMAAGKGHEEVVRYLIGAKANINGGGKDGATPLIKAAISGNTNACKALIELKATIDTKMDEGWSALSLAEHYKHQPCVDLLKNCTTASMAVNDEGAPVQFGNGACSSKYYCGRNLGKAAIPGSDGRCGPNNGPQCASCKRYQAAPQSAGSGSLPNAVVVKCHKHPLVRFDNGSTTWYCDDKCGSCSRSSEGPTIRWSCRDCGYDQCCSCVTHHLDKASSDKKCTDCKKVLPWSDYAEGPYKAGWNCNTCKGKRKDLGNFRWFCQSCQNDYCHDCYKKL